MPNQRKRPRMPKLPLQHTTPPAHIRLRPPPRIPSIVTNTPDPIKTPYFTPQHRSSSPLRTRNTNSPLPNQSPIQSPPIQSPPIPTPTQTPLPPTPHPHNHSRTPSDWSGGLFSGHPPLTLDTLHPTPPTDVIRRTPLVAKPVDARDARVRRLSFGGEVSARGVVVARQSGEDVLNKTRKSVEKRKRASFDFEENRDSGIRTNRRRSIPDERHVTQDRYECSQNEDFHSLEGVDVPACVSQASEEQIPETPILPRDVRDRTPETTVRRCRAPVWDGAITEIPETPVEQLPPREAPLYVVRTAITASAEVPSLEEGREELCDEGEGRRMGLLWLDIGGGTVRDNGDDTRLGEDSDSVSTEPPSPRKEEVVSTRAQVFCRSVRVSIPAGGFRSPSPEPSLTDL